MITITETDNIFSFGTRFKIVLAHISIYALDNILVYYYL